MLLASFLVGAIILVVEIMGTRVISPYYGASIYVWSSLIGVTLASLTAGYVLGGWSADRWPHLPALAFEMIGGALCLLLVPWMRLGVVDGDDGDALDGGGVGVGDAVAAGRGDDAADQVAGVCRRVLVDGGQLHVGLLALVVQKVHPANRAHDAAGPGVWLAAGQWRRSLARQFLGQTAAESGVFFVQVILAERIDQTDNLLEDGSHFLGYPGTGSFSFSHW